MCSSTTFSSPEMQTRIICLLVFFATILLVASEKPEFPTEELCKLYKAKCETKLKKSNCQERQQECLKYANNGLKVTWNFCEFSFLPLRQYLWPTVFF
ncbi:hypothetical protein Y032_0680g1471 [Ancylostoma ceylanicum]|uniref:ShKT domain-containing protein n=1 Tax=Ancylostoma ceylanicum TaxID=53326 RepID=A0A016WJ86_9BILA|nr:hypothetical protein Y032_0680g1471 [Ancylostoma ceylanicum]